MPSISVIMGVYNFDRERLYKSVRSILAQSYGDFELIICDDGSRDSSLETLKELERLDPRIKAIGYQPNRGLAHALNTCLGEARGRFIARMDDDDVAHPERFQRQVDFLERHGEYAFVGSIARVFNDGGVWGRLVMPERPTKHDFLWNIPFIHPSMIFRREALAAAGGYSEAPCDKRCEDYTLVMELYSLGLYGYNIQEPLIDYRVENGEKKYRPMRDRLAEAEVRWRGYRKLGLLPKGLPYIVKPLLVGLIPQRAFREIKKWQYGRR